MWNDLSLTQKNELMKIYLRNGITSLDDMKAHYNSFALGGPTKPIKTISPIPPIDVSIEGNGPYVDQRPVNVRTFYDKNKNDTSRSVDTAYMRQMDEALIRQGMPRTQRQAVLYSAYREGSRLGSHGNGATGTLGWRGKRANDVKESYDSQAAKIYAETFGRFNGDNWNRGYSSSGYKSGRQAQQAFVNATNLTDAIKALNYGYVRPPEEESKLRTARGGNSFVEGGRFDDSTIC